MTGHKLITGITGGIGSGKSTIATILEKLGFPVYYADTEAKLLMNTDPSIRERLTQLFGPQAYNVSGLDRPFIASRIFNDEESKLRMNAIVHPRVRAHFDDWAAAQQNSLVFQESALLFETESYRRFDKTLLVTAPEELRIQRVQSRDGFSESEIRSRMNSQLKDEEKIPLADYIILNDGQTLVIPQVLNVVKDLRAAVQSTSS